MYWSVQLELVREEKLRNSDPIGTLQELSGGWVALNSSAREILLLPTRI